MADTTVDWGSAPQPFLAGLVETLSATLALPAHQAAFSLSSLRSVNRHWRAAADDACACVSWATPSPLLSTPDSERPRLTALLRRFKNLRSLELDWGEEAAGPPLGPATLAALASLRRLETLSIAGCCPSTDLLRGIASLPSLRHFSFSPAADEHECSSAGSGNVSLAPLSACTNLTSLDLASCGFAGAEADVVALLRGATRLQQLSLYRTVRATAMQAQHGFDIGFATQLTSLELRCSFTEDDSWAGLCCQLTNLRRLDASGSPRLTDDGLRAFTRLAGSLTGLVLQGGHEVSEDGSTALALLTGLRSLDLGFSNRMSGPSLLPLIGGSLTQLTFLDVCNCPRACSLPALQHLTRLHHLQHLSAAACRLQPGAVRVLASLTSLEHLNIEGNPQLGELSALTTLRSLRFLDASECALQGAHLVPLLASLPQARTVLLNDNDDLSVAVLEALVAGPSAACLRVLGLAGLQLEGGVLQKLLPRLEALQELDVSGGACASGDIADAWGLLAGAGAMPALHTLSALELNPPPPDAWWEEARAWAARRPMLRLTV